MLMVSESAAQCCPMAEICRGNKKFPLPHDSSREIFPADSEFPASALSWRNPARFLRALSEAMLSP
jgi:hypothetical protein